MTDAPERPALTWGLPAALALICALEAAALLAPRPRPPVLAPAARPEVSAQRAPLPEALRADLAFASRMTPDDVARGVQALADLPEGAPLGLTHDQRDALLGLSARGVTHKLRLDALKERRRSLELAWTQEAARVASALGPQRIAAMQPERAAPPTPSAGGAPPPQGPPPQGPPPQGPPPQGPQQPGPPNPPERR